MSNTNSKPAKKDRPLKLTIRSWPKMIFLYPSAVAALVLGLSTYYYPGSESLWGGIFMFILVLNFIVLTFEFPRGTSLTVFFAIVTFLLLLKFTNDSLEIFTPIKHFFANTNIHASPQFYYWFFCVFLGLAISMYIYTRFGYYELSPNELIYHHGILGNIERYSTVGLKLNTEVTDVFEYVIAGAGTVVMILPGQPRPIILENVLAIRTIQRESDRILDAKVVRVERNEGSSASTGLSPSQMDEAGG